MCTSMEPWPAHRPRLPTTTSMRLQLVLLWLSTSLTPMLPLTICENDSQNLYVAFRHFNDLVRIARCTPRERVMSTPPQLPPNLQADPPGIAEPSRGLFADTGPVTAPSAWVETQVAASTTQSQMPFAQAMTGAYEGAAPSVPVFMQARHRCCRPQ